MMPLRIAACCLLLLACNAQKPEALLTGAWQGVAIHNPEVEELLAAQKNLLDTMGRQTPEADYERAFGVRNLDSFRKAGYQAVEEMRLYLKKSVPLTRFEFRKDGVAVLRYPEGADSARYTLEGDSVVVLNERALKTVGTERLEMFVDRLTADSLRLRLPAGKYVNTMTFRKVRP